MNLPLELIRAVPEAQSRCEIDEATVEAYADALRDGETLPPIVVFFDGTEYWLSDGFHRLAAFRRLGATSVPVHKQTGGLRDAILHSVGANARHGLPRTNRDKRRAVEILLRDKVWGKKSLRWIAKQAAVSKSFVHKVAEEVTGHGGQLPPRREGLDGKERRARRKSDTSPAVSVVDDGTVHKDPAGALPLEEADVQEDVDATGPIVGPAAGGDGVCHTPSEAIVEVTAEAPAALPPEAPDDFEEFARLALALPRELRIRLARQLLASIKDEEAAA